MTVVHHNHCGSIQAGPDMTACCHGLLLDGPGGLALVDAGIGLLDARSPDERIGRGLIEAVGFLFDEDDTAVRRVEELGFSADDVRHIVLTHADPDHAGGLADFPHATVHLSEEEHSSILTGNPRYLPAQFAHGPRWRTYPRSDRRWYGLEARPVDMGQVTEVLLIPLVGHTLGHSGVAIRQGDGWLLHAGDAYYLRAELASDDHPVSRLASQRADDDARRRASLEQLRRLAREHPGEIELFGYHDPGEFPTRGWTRRPR
jgi:glyoxylase-like metal-dependent hydrolase (beta-lactamase superfamily II)